MYKWSLYNKNHTSITCYINFNLVVFSPSSLFVIDNIKQRWTSNWVSLVNLVSFTVFNSVERRRLSLDARYQEEKKERRRKTNKDKRNSSIYYFFFRVFVFSGQGRMSDIKNGWTFITRSANSTLFLFLFAENSHIDLFSNRPQPKKKRKSRTAFTNHQIFELEKRFLYQKYLSPADRDEIAAALGLSNAQVSIII